MYSTADSGVACTIRASKASGSFAPRMRVRALAAYDAATESIFSTRPEKGSSLRYRLISSEKVYAKAGVRPLSPTSDRQTPTIALQNRSSNGFANPYFRVRAWNARPSSRTKTGRVPEEPRSVAALAGELVEAPRSHERSFCCGAGGGLVFLGEEKGERVSHVRAAELAATGASVVGTACPFCNTMFRDAFAAKGEGAPELMDIAQLAARGLPE